MGLFDKLRKPKWKDENPQVRIEGVNELAQDVKHIKKNQEILKDILENDPDSDVRISAIQKVNSDASIKEAALNDPDWRVRKAAVENLKIYLDNTIKFLPEEHYKVNKPLVDFLKKISKNDSNSDVRNAADKLVNDRKYNEDLLKKKINYTVVDVRNDTRKKITLTLNEKYEYVCNPSSVEEILDCAFGGDIITIEYVSKRDRFDKFFTVDYNILDEHISNPNAIKIEGRPFKKLVTYTDLPKFIKSEISAAVHGEHLLLLEYIMIHDNSVFLVKTGDKINLNSENLKDYKPPEQDYTKFIEGGMKITDLPRSPNTGIFHEKLEVRKIEFICRKVNQLPISENMTIYRE